MRGPLTLFKDAAATARSNVQETGEDAVSIVWVVNAAFTGTVDIQGSMDGSNWVNVRYTSQKGDGVVSPVDDQITYTTDSSIYSYNIRSKYRYISINMTRSAGTITAELYGTSTGGASLVDAYTSTQVSYTDATRLNLGTDNDGYFAFDGTKLTLLAAADDTVFEIGNGTNSWGNTTAAYTTWDASANALIATGLVTEEGFKTKIVADATATLTIDATHSGKLITTRGGSGMTITLPAVAAGLVGTDVMIVNVSASTLTVQATAGEMVYFNDLTANSVALSTNSEKIGGGFRCICDGTSWIVIPMTEETQTVTVTT